MTTTSSVGSSSKDPRSPVDRAHAAEVMSGGVCLKQPPTLVGRGLIGVRVGQAAGATSTGVFGRATVLMPLVTDNPTTGVYSWVWFTNMPVK